MVEGIYIGSYRDFYFKPFSGVLTSDASNAGWGAHHNNTSWNGRWNEHELTWHINVLELYAVFLALKSLLTKEFCGAYFNIRTDNTTAVSYINKKGGTKSISCAKVAFDIWRLLEQFDCLAFASHIPGAHNVLADVYSRKFKDNIEWTLSQDIYDFITTSWGTLTIDSLHPDSTRSAKPMWHGNRIQMLPF